MKHKCKYQISPQCTRKLGHVMSKCVKCSILVCSACSFHHDQRIGDGTHRQRCTYTLIEPKVKSERIKVPSWFFHNDGIYPPSRNPIYERKIPWIRRINGRRDANYNLGIEGSPYHIFKLFYKCPFCELEPNSEKECTDHIHNIHNAVRCPICMNYLLNRGEQMDHILSNERCLDRMLSDHHGTLLVMIIKNLQFMKRKLGE